MRSSDKNWIPKKSYFVIVLDDLDISNSLDALFCIIYFAKSFKDALRSNM